METGWIHAQSFGGVRRKELSFSEGRCDMGISELHLCDVREFPEEKNIPSLKYVFLRKQKKVIFLCGCFVEGVYFLFGLENSFG